jgi:hypothetical protein
MAKRKVKSKRQPSLPGFPDIPEKLEIKIPHMPMWKQIGGHGDGGALLARSESDDAIELLEIQVVREYVGDKEAAEVGFPFWTREAYYYLADLDPKNEEVQSALKYTGFTEGDQKFWFEDEATPEERALVIAESLHSYGSKVEEGNAGWSEDVVPDEVEWENGKVGGSEHLEGEDESFRDDVLGYSDIRQKLEETVEEMANGSAAQTWSTVGDQAADDAAREGFDKDSLIGVAEFGDAVAVNGDIESEKTWAGVLAELEKDGYEETDIGGKVPTTEEFVDPASVIRHVAKEMDIEEDVVEKAAEGIDWWPKSGNEEIANSTSGWAIVFGKKDPDAHVEDGDYIVQGAYSDGTIVGGLGGGGGETFSLNDEKAAISAAKKLLKDPTFEGDNTRVITRDGELVWSSDPEVTEAPRRRSRRR